MFLKPIHCFTVVVHQMFFCSCLPADAAACESLLQKLLQELKTLLLHMGRLHELLPHTLVTCASSLGNQSGAAGYHPFHLHLELHWAVTETLFIILTKFPGNVRVPDTTDT